ncbi:cell adhesion molecule Dscam2 isoform X1 [Onthophagus taurus]|uniref:cell adhesion molecule Dscam2 isoform X1 n=1 Tax=Onthophagus taurus TaxID=166361 RepID=UPI0039BE1FCF
MELYLHKSFLPLLILSLGLDLLFVGAEDVKDTREGEDVTLECRFSPKTATGELTYYWVRSNKQTHDNAAIGKVPLDNNYKLNYQPEKGIYDLLISNASYDRDNGKFECKVKAGGSGTNLHSQSYSLTVLTPPQAPTVMPGTYVTATEGKTLDLTCSTMGGSPDPIVRWYREDSDYPLETALKNGGSRDQATTATLAITPDKEDDGAVFRCEVWNRAMGQNKKLEATVTLSVNYFPRVEVGPENPLKIERDSAATLQCNVDAKPKATSIHWARNGRFITTSTNHVLHRVSIQDAGQYTCRADNGLGKVGEKEITLDVLYAPIVTLESKTKEAEEGETVTIKCNVTANPFSHIIEWIHDSKPDFRQNGDTLRLNRVSAENAGTYICRAVNLLKPSGVPNNRAPLEKIGNASIAVLIRHKPGKARIMPDKPIANEGSAVTLTCTASPSGWPAPQYRWFKMGNDGQSSILATGIKYSINSANIVNEGTYNCQATNELGPGEVASVTLEVHQPPSFKYKLKPLETKRVGDPNFSVACSAKGKPKPTVRWLKDNEELTADTNMYEVKTEHSVSSNNAVSVQSILRFSGKARPNSNELLPSDRGTYTCAFENEVRNAESSMHLRIEHEPIILHKYNKVAFDKHETAEVICKVQAYPKPEFKWFFGSSNSQLTSSAGHYVIKPSNKENDTYISKLQISDIKQQDYGEYNCHVMNSLGGIDVKIRLQPKGPPEKPSDLAALYIGPNYVTLNWQAGFTGGISTTKYYVSYKKIPANDNLNIDGCGTITRSPDWSEADCKHDIPCNVSHLEQHQHYTFKVKAVNSKGKSDYSHEISVTTRVDRLPIPQKVTYDPSSHVLHVEVPSTCLPLVAIVESITNENMPVPTWKVLDTLPLEVSGMMSTYKEANLDQVVSRMYRGKMLLDDQLNMDEEYQSRVRVKFCLGTHLEHCGDSIEAEIGTAYIKEASALGTPTVIAIIVTAIVAILFGVLVLMFCRCKKNQTKKAQSKDYESDSVRPTIVSSQNQAPPPYYPSTGMENKALDHNLDLALALEDQKSVYATQNGYGYHVGNPDIQSRPNINNGEWANIGYLENSYSNSNNGGSVNSQDSLWQMKMAAAANNSVNQLQPHLNVDRQNSYGYDPITHGGYGAVDDYAPYTHITTQSNHGDDYMRNSNNPSRQEYCNDPYAAVHKPKKRIEQHIDSPYHDVSGLPDPYLEQMEEEKPPQHMSLSYEESLESGYSTPNSRTRRVIREIIV